MSVEESDLLSDVNLFCWNAEVLAMERLHAIELPLCGFLTRCSAKDCNDLLRYMLNDLKSLNQPTMETILLNYFLTDYISCGFSSPIFHSVFHKYILSDDAKRSLIRLIIKVWSSIFEQFKITSLNVEFVKDFVVSLERVFIKITNSVPECVILFQKNNVVSKIKKLILKYEREIRKSVENVVPKKSTKSMIKLLIQNQVQQEEKNQGQNMKCLSSDNQQLKRKVEPFSDQHNLLKQPKLMSNNDLQNISIQSSKSDPNNTPVQPADQKLNVFQVMMLNAKKRKSIVK